jgi:adenylate kinase
MKHNRISIVTGMSGCGKDFLLNQSHASGSLPISLPVISFGEALSQRLKQEAAMSAQEGRDGLKMLPLEIISRYTGILIGEMIERQPVILNSHTVYRQGDNLVINPVSERRLNPSHYIFVSASPDNMETWRASDTTRQRPVETTQQIELHQTIALGVVRAISDVMDSQLLVVHNTLENTAANIQRIGNFLSSL